MHNDVLGLEEYLKIKFLRLWISLAVLWVQVGPVGRIWRGKGSKNSTCRMVVVSFFSWKTLKSSIGIYLVFHQEVNAFFDSKEVFFFFILNRVHGITTFLRFCLALWEHQDLQNSSPSTLLPPGFMDSAGISNMSCGKGFGWLTRLRSWEIREVAEKPELAFHI